MKKDKKIGIAGIGNYLLGDEGFGVHVVHYLQEQYDFPDTVNIQDVGTAGIYMAPFLEECDPVFVVDVVDLEGEPGKFHHFMLEDIKSGNIQMRMSPHQLGLVEILEISKLRGSAPEQLEFFTVIPKSLTESVELSETLSKQKIEVANMIITRLFALGIVVKRKQSTKNYGRINA